MYRDRSEDNPDVMVYKVIFSQKYLIPAKLDILLLFKPVKAYNGLTSPSGRI